MKLTSISKTSTEILVELLENNQSIYLDMWREKTLINQDDINKDIVKENGLQMYEIVKKTITNSTSESEIKLLAYKVARERVEANINIGDFVYNVNLGRSIIIKYANQSGISIEDLQPIIDNINSQFDRFCYYAVTRYTEIKNQVIQEKNLFITQTHKDRLAILGQMSSSFVHEFRNPLTSVIGFIKLLKGEYSTLKYLDIIEHELEQLKFRITQFLHTSKVDVAEKIIEEVDIRNLLEEVLNFLYPSIVDGDVNVFKNFNSNINIKVHKDQLKQVFLNLLMNSIDAVKQQDKRRKIIVSYQRVYDQILITISNNGPVIPPGTLNTIFEPFYTTKKLGTGIGLFVCKNIIEKHDGSISCQSNDRRTTFTIHLPI